MEALLSIRIRYSRGDEVKYISHLDLMRTFERALRRTDIAVAYTGGFNPRMKLVFGLPLPVGMTSEAEYADIDTDEEINPEDFLEKLNSQLPSGLKVLEAAVKKDSRNIMASIAAAQYEITISVGNVKTVREIHDAIMGFISQDKILAEKESKNRTAIVDIKPLILNVSLYAGTENTYKLRDIGNNSAGDNCGKNKGQEHGENNSGLSENLTGGIKLNVTVRAGNTENLKPDLLINALSQWSGINMKVLKIHRVNLYIAGEKGELISPMHSSVVLRR